MVLIDADLFLACLYPSFSGTLTVPGKRTDKQRDGQRLVQGFVNPGSPLLLNQIVCLTSCS